MKHVAALARDDVEDRTLHIAVLGRRAELYDLDFLYGVATHPWRRADIRAVDLVLILVRAAAHRLRAGALAHVRVAADAWRRVHEVEIGEAFGRRVLHPLAVIRGAHFGRRRVHDRAGAFDGDHFRERADAKDHVDFDRRAYGHC